MIHHSSNLHFKNMYNIFKDDLNKTYPDLSEEISTNLKILSIFANQQLIIHQCIKKLLF